MSEAKEPFGKCPDCNRRSRRKPVSEEFTGDGKRTVETLQDQLVYIGLLPYGPGSAAIPFGVQKSTPITVDIKVFRYAYRCEYCGHTWTETREELARAK